MLLLVVLAGTLFIATGNEADPDLWGHVLYGRDVLQSGELPRTATYTYTATEHPWINHENLSEIAFAAVERFAGGPGLMALKCLLGAFVLALLASTLARQVVSLPVAAVVFMLVAYNLAVGWSIRPQLFTYAFFALVMLVLDGCFPVRYADAERRAPAPAAREGRLWLLPPLFAVWANAHGGFVAGLGLVGLYLGVRGLEALWRDGRAAWWTVVRYGAVVGASVAATLINPYGVEYLTWLYADLIPPRPEIVEWLPLWEADAAVAVRVVLLLELVAAGWLASRRPWDLARSVVMAVAVWQAVAHVRHGPFVAILAGLWCPHHLEGVRLRLRRAPAPPSVRAAPPSRLMLAASRAVALVVAGAVVSTCAGGVLVDRSWYPVKAFRFMAHHRLVGRAVVHFDWSQYALAAFAPATTVAFDGRFRTAFPQEMADVHFDFIMGDGLTGRWRLAESGPIDGRRALEAGNPDLVLVNRRFPDSVAVMAAAPGWVLLYQDQIAQLWGRASLYDDPAGARYLAPAKRRITERVQAGFVAWPALPTRTRVAG
jgi:hypothetical protein